MGWDESQNRAPVTLRVISSETPAAPRTEAPPPAPDATPSGPPPAAAPAPVPVPAPPEARRAEESPTSPGTPLRTAVGTIVPALPTGRLAAVFVGSFGLTATAVLGVWFGVVRPSRPAPVAVPPPAPIVMIAPAPAPAPAEPPAPVGAVAVDPVADAAEAPEVVEPPVVEPPRAPAPRRAPRPAPAPAVVAETAPEPVVAPAPAPVVAPAPAPAPAPPAPTVPEAVAVHAGTYVGRVLSKPMTIDLAFRPDGKLTGIVRTHDGDQTEEVRATGTWTLAEDGAVTVALVESGAAAPRVWSARVADGEIDGRLVEDSRTTRRFHGSR